MSADVAAPAPTRNFAAYRAACAEAAAQPPAAWTFKADPRYTRILEHVTPAQGEAFLDLVRAGFPAVWDRVRREFAALAGENDDLGRPVRARFPDLGTDCSPSNLRYLYHALRVLRHAQALGLADLRVVELGGGYGGLALYVSRLAPLFGVAVGDYVIVDVPEAGALQAAYARALALPLRTADGLSAAALEGAFRPDDGAPRFLVSNYAFSEFDAETRAWYEARLVRKCTHGFLVWNFATPLVGVAEKPLGGPLYPFTDAPLTTEPERPETGPGNLVVTF